MPYPELGVTARRAIWTTFLAKASLRVSVADLDRLAEHRINGRQVCMSLLYVLKRGLKSSDTDQERGQQRTDDLPGEWIHLLEARGCRRRARRSARLAICYAGSKSCGVG